MMNKDENETHSADTAAALSFLCFAVLVLLVLLPLLPLLLSLLFLHFLFVLLFLPLFFVNLVPFFNRLLPFFVLRARFVFLPLFLVFLICFVRRLQILSSKEGFECLEPATNRENAPNLLPLSGRQSVSFPFSRHQLGEVDHPQIGVLCAV